MGDIAEITRTEVTIHGWSGTIRVADEQTLLAAMEAQVIWPNPMPIRVGCRRGGCGACRIRVLSGDYRTGKMSRAHVSEDEQQQGYALACKLVPLSDLEIETAFRGPREPD